MRVNQARVLIINPQTNESLALPDFIGQSGGTVVEHFLTASAATEAINSPEFPGNVGSPNAVLIGGNITTSSSEEPPRSWTMIV
jgi:hypothetical protein